MSVNKDYAIDYVEPDGDVYRLLELWSRDKYGNSLLEHDDDFDLYRIIAKNVRSAVPVKQLEKSVPEIYYSTGRCSTELYYINTNLIKIKI